MQPDRRPDRLAALRRRLGERGVDALLVTHLPNIQYLTGFRGSAGMLLVDPERSVLVTDSRYSIQAPAEAHGAAAVEIEPVNLWDRLRLVLTGRMVRSLGFESDRLTVSGAERLHGAWPGRLEPLVGTVEDLRAVKDAGEIEAIRQAVALAQEALVVVLETIRVGQTERQIAARLEAELRGRGGEWHPFPTIVASGPRSALPHADPSDRVVGAGDLLLLDFGARLQGYCSDLTRTVVVGADPTDRQREVHRAVLGAQRAGFAALASGRTGPEVDQAARSTLEGAGFGAGILHSTGHGIGLELHEEPRLARSVNNPVYPGAVVTIEPGVYLEGWGGIRIEDDVVVRAGGAEYLSAPSQELLTVR